MSQRSNYVQIRPNNIPSDGKLSFKKGFPTIQFTIQAQAGILNLDSIRMNGILNVYRTSTTKPTDATANNPTMDNRLGIFNIIDQITIRRTNRGQNQICETINHYPRYISSLMGVGHSLNDLMGHMGQSSLIFPTPDAFFGSVVLQNASDSKKPYFSTQLPCGFLKSGNMLNLMESSFGTMEIEIRLAPDQACLFPTINASGTTGILDAFYELEDVELTYEVEPIPEDQMSAMMSQTEGSIEYNGITSLYAVVNSTNAQIQFSLGLRHLQSVFMNFCPSVNINTLSANGNALTYPSKANGDLAHFKRIYWLRGGTRFPLSFDIVGNKDNDSNTSVADPLMMKMFVQSILPAGQSERTSISTQNNNRAYQVNLTGDTPYVDLSDGGALFGLGCRYSQFNDGIDFSTRQWGVSLESDLTDDSPQSVFLYFKSKHTLLWNQSGVQLIV